VCVGCSARYEIIDGIPILLPSNIGYDQDLANKSFSPEYRELLKREADLTIDKYAQADIDLIESSAKNKDNFLEIGCGRGRVCNNFSLLNRFKMVVGLDLSLDALILAKKISDNNNLNSLFICGDILNPPFKDNCFDIVFGGGSFEHFKDTQKGVESLRCIVKSDADIVLTIPCVSLTTLFQGLLTGNTPDVLLLRELYNFIHTNIMKDKYRVFGFEYSFIPKLLSRKFSMGGFKTYSIGRYDVEYDLKFIPFGKKYINSLLRLRLFWPMFFLKCKRSL